MGIAYQKLMTILNVASLTLQGVLKRCVCHWSKSENLHLSDIQDSTTNIPQNLMKNFSRDQLFFLSFFYTDKKGLGSEGSNWGRSDNQKQTFYPIIAHCIIITIRPVKIKLHLPDYSCNPQQMS